MKIGYARVSSEGQSLDVQLAALKQAGCERIFEEKRSGGSTDGREELAKALLTLRDGDVLVVTRLDRLARSVPDLHRILADVTQAGAGFACIEQGEIDTTRSTGKLMLSILGAFAEFERDLIRERQREGIERRKASGGYAGVGRKVSVARELVLEAYRAGMKPRAIAAHLKVGKTTVYRILDEAGVELGEDAATRAIKAKKEKA